MPPDTSVSEKRWPTERRTDAACVGVTGNGANTTDAWSAFRAQVERVRVVQEVASASRPLLVQLHAAGGSWCELSAEGSGSAPCEVNPARRCAVGNGTSLGHPRPRAENSPGVPTELPLATSASRL